jgi:hypothetical protein
MLVDGWAGGRSDWSGPPSNGTRRVALRPNLSMMLGVSRTIEGTALLSASVGDVCFRKIVHPTGSFHAQLDYGRDRLAVAAFEGRMSLTYGSRSVLLSNGQCPEEDWRGARELMLAAPSARMFRRLSTELEADAGLDLERLGLRMTGALLGEVDGDEGAVRRLGRVLIAQAGVQQRRASPVEGDRHLTPVFAAALAASADLEERMRKGGVWVPDRIGPQLEWVLRVEAVWFVAACRDADATAGRHRPHCEGDEAC